MLRFYILGPSSFPGPLVTRRWRKYYGCMPYREFNSVTHLWRGCVTLEYGAVTTPIRCLGRRFFWRYSRVGIRYILRLCKLGRDLCCAEFLVCLDADRFSSEAAKSRSKLGRCGCTRCPRPDAKRWKDVGMNCWKQQTKLCIVRRDRCFKLMKV